MFTSGKWSQNDLKEEELKKKITRIKWTEEQKKKHNFKEDIKIKKPPIVINNVCNHLC